MISYKAHVQNKGWTAEVFDGAMAGTTGEGLRLEALIVNSDYPLEYRAHVQNAGWQGWVGRGEEAGTTGDGLRLEAFCIRLLGDTGKHVWYRAHIENVGWTDWTIDGAIAGSVGESLRLEAIEIQIVDEASSEEFAKWYEESKKCKLGDVIFTVTTDESITMSNDITDKAIEGGTVSDHVINKPMTMSINGIIVGDDAAEKLQTLRDYLKNGDLLRYVGMDTATNMLIETLTTNRSVSIKGGVSFSLSLKEIRIATGLVTVIDQAYVYTQANKVDAGGVQEVVVTTAEANAVTETVGVTEENGAVSITNNSDLYYGTGLTFQSLDYSNQTPYVYVYKDKIPYTIKLRTSDPGWKLGDEYTGPWEWTSYTIDYNAEGDYFTTKIVDNDGNTVSEATKLTIGADLGNGISVKNVSSDPNKNTVGWNDLGEEKTLGQGGVMLVWDGWYQNE